MEPSFEEELVDTLAISVRGGMSLDAAALKLLRMRCTQEEVDGARLAYERKIGVVQRLEDAPALTATGYMPHPWYVETASDVFWPALRAELAKDLPVDALVSVDASSTRIVNLLSRPSDASITTRGLVLGYVQSGKTTSFTSVIAKAADAGYRMFIVLSGLTDNLRYQTQARLHDQLIAGGSDHWYKLTTLDHDFLTTSENASFLMRRTSGKFLGVIKKNPHRLRRLLEWLQSAGSTLADCPILIIDDEADQGSIDVGARGRQSRINGLIKQIVASPKAAYVAYSATPFANLLIDPTNDADLYPRDFIVDLPRPKAYFGPEALFGRQVLDEGDEDSDGLDVIREVAAQEVAGVQPPRGRGAVDGWVPSLSPSLDASIRWFLMATAARRVRGTGNVHSSMLVHTSMLAAAHEKLAGPVRHVLSTLRTALPQQELQNELRRQWDDETGRVDAREYGLEPVPFADVMEGLPDVIAATKVIIDNYVSDERLSYDRSDPAITIVIGGNTLSRGLTLEGLVSSYFVRSAAAYDTVLQMGRWFGYRVGYEDLPRVWMTDDLKSWFADLALVEEEIRREIRRYELLHETPLNLRVAIRNHPAMAITSAAKMRNAVPVRISFSDQRKQTILFNHKDRAWLDRNLEAARTLVSRGVEGGGTFVDRAMSGRQLLRDVPVDVVLRFLDDYQFHVSATDVTGGAMSQYIESQTRAGGLRKWNVAVIGEPIGSGVVETGIDLGFPLRSRRITRSRVEGTVDYANIKTLVSRADRLADVDVSKADIAKLVTAQMGRSETDSTRGNAEESVFRQLRNDLVGDHGLICLYPIDPVSEVRRTGVTQTKRVALEAVSDVIGVGLFFPTAIGKIPEVEYFAAKLDPRAEVSFEDEEMEQLLEQLAQADLRDEEAAKAGVNHV